MNRIRKVVYAALIAALACVATMIIKVPSPLNGYVNLGDSVVLLAGFALSPLYGFLAAGLGSALADLLLGYALYAPATFLIKGLMALVAFYGFGLLNKRMKKLPSQILSGVLAEVLMVLGYLVFEGFLYGFSAALVNVPANAVQGVFGIVVGTLLMKVFEKAKINLK